MLEVAEHERNAGFAQQYAIDLRDLPGCGPGCVALRCACARREQLIAAARTYFD